jgi:hypothetical protein
MDIITFLVSVFCLVDDFVKDKPLRQRGPHLTQHAIFTSKCDIRQHLDRGFARLRQHPDILLGLFHLAGLSLKHL